MRERFQKVFSLFCTLMVCANILITPVYAASSNGFNYHNVGVWGEILHF